MVTITEKGQGALLTALPLWEEAQAWVIGQIGEDRWRAMLAHWAELVSLVRRRAGVFRGAWPGVDEPAPFAPRDDR